MYKKYISAMSDTETPKKMTLIAEISVHHALKTTKTIATISFPLSPAKIVVSKHGENAIKMWPYYTNLR